MKSPKKGQTVFLTTTCGVFRAVYDGRFIAARSNTKPQYFSDDIIVSWKKAE